MSQNSNKFNIRTVNPKPVPIKLPPRTVVVKIKTQQNQNQVLENPKPTI